MIQRTRAWTAHGYREAGLGTADPDFWLNCFLNRGGWSLLWQGAGSAQPLWPRAAPRPRYEWLLGQDDWSTGQLRLFAFDEGVPAPREDAHPWDTGGIFDLDVRVKNLPAWSERLLADGFQGFSEPITWPFGDLQISEWLARGPDGVVLALVERIHPPLEREVSATGFSHAFNSSQTVRDVDAHLGFFAKLGFRPRVRQSEPLGGRGGEMLGLAPDRAATTPVDLAICHPTGDLQGSVEFVALPETSGHHIDVPASPACRGLNLLRFPVDGIEAMAGDLRRSGVSHTGLAQWTLPPIGPVLGIAVRTPDGSWLELIEPCG